MTKYTSGRQRNLKVGISSYSENLTSIEVIGNVGIATTNATSKLWVDGDGYFTGVVTSSNFYVGNQLISAASSLSQLYISGISTFVGFSTFRNNVSIAGSLDVNGNINFNGSLFQNNQPFVASRWTQTTTGDNIYRLSNVGIGTSTLLGALTVSGDGYFTGVITASTFNGQVNAGVSTLGVATATNLTAQQLNVSGVSTFAGIATHTAGLFGTNASFTGIVTASSFRGDGSQLTGIAATTDVRTNSLVVTGVSTLGVTSTTNLTAQQLNVSGVSTFSAGPVFIGSGTTTGTASQRLQVTGGAYVSGAVGVGTTNPRENLDVVGTIGIQSASSSNRFEIQHNAALNSLDFIFI